MALGRDTGMPIGKYMRLAPRGGGFNVTWMDVYRIRNGQIVEMIAEMNMDTIRKQLAG